VSQQRVGPQAATIGFANNFGRVTEPTFFWGGKRRQGSRGNFPTCLILMGDWCDSFATKY